MGEQDAWGESESFRRHPPLTMQPLSRAVSANENTEKKISLAYLAMLKVGQLSIGPAKVSGVQQPWIGGISLFDSSKERELRMAKTSGSFLHAEARSNDGCAETEHIKSESDRKYRSGHRVSATFPQMAMMTSKPRKSPPFSYTGADS